MEPDEEQETPMSKDKGGLSVARMRGIHAPEPLPEAFETMLPSGLVVKWRMPDPFTIVAFDGVIPDPLTAAVIDLLKAEKSYTSDTDPMRHRHEAANIKGMYGLAGAMLETPKLDASLEYGDGNGTLGRREVGYQDIVALFQLWRFSTRTPPGASPSADEPQRSADAALDSDGVSPDTSAADGDNRPA